MSGDPAVEAAHRSFHPKYDYSWGDKTSGVASAREALRPIREWYEKASTEAEAEDLYEQQDLLESLASLIFTTEEIESWSLNHAKP